MSKGADQVWAAHSYGTPQTNDERPLVPTGVLPPAAQPDLKPTNPKDGVGSSKLPLDMVPDTLSFFAAAAFAEGYTKYGGYNWRRAGVRSSIYKAALERHLKKWWNGEDCDPKTKVPHLASVIACAAIVLDAEVCNKLTDDRPPKADLAGLAERMEAVFAHLREMHKDMKPVHQTEKPL